MIHDISVNVVGPAKSGKSKVVAIIERAVEGLDVRVTEANVKGQPTLPAGSERGKQ